jgi:hypothetical protein
MILQEIVAVTGASYRTVAAYALLTRRDGRKTGKRLFSLNSRLR